MAGLRRVRLEELNAQTSGAMIVAVVVGVGAGARVLHSVGREPRAVWTCTLRDSPVDIVNLEAWGSPAFALQLERAFHVGNVVDVLSPRIKTRQLDDRNEQFSPQVSSPFHLVLNERQSDICIHEGDDFVDYLPLLQIPTKPASGFYTLADVLNHSQNIRGDYVDLLVAVRAIFPTRNIKTKQGTEIQNREISTFDQTTTSPFKITFWDQESIKRADGWKSRETLLFISDVKLEWSEFNKSIIGRINFRTIITEDPNTQEAEKLRKFVANAPLQRVAVVNEITRNIPDLNTIRNVMTVRQVFDRANEEINPQFTALMYVTITNLDLDGYSKITMTKCGGCSSFLKGPQFLCSNNECSNLMSDLLGPQISFDIRVSITDHTGSITDCKLAGKDAENILGCKVTLVHGRGYIPDMVSINEILQSMEDSTKTIGKLEKTLEKESRFPCLALSNCQVEDFIAMDVNSKGLLKWRLLLERCTVRLIVMKGPIVSILSCSVSDPNEVINKLPVYRI